MSSPTSSPVSSPSSSIKDVSTVLTPSKKVKALLAQFSDSESETRERPRTQLNAHTRTVSVSAEHTTSDSETEDEDRVQPQGRLAVRLLGGLTNRGTRAKPHDLPRAASDATHISPLSTSNSIIPATRSLNTAESTDDEITSAAPVRRRLLGKRKHSSEDVNTTPQRAARSQSPLFFPSPSNSETIAAPRAISPRNVSPGPLASAKDKDRPKFLALVEKHRKARIAREAAEIAKRAAGVLESGDETPRRIRGSSPADDSSEGSGSGDEDAVKRIQRQARPTRKASKKALEEMNRETQRMSRNMQLAHQARTKKKITKDSLLARFNYTVNLEQGDGQPSIVKDSTTSSSNVASDMESRDSRQTTPPTSPIHSEEKIEHPPQDFEVKDVTHLLTSGKIHVEMYGALLWEDDLPSLEEIVAKSPSNKRKQRLLDYHNNDMTVISPNSKTNKIATGLTSTVPVIDLHQKPGSRLSRVNLARTVSAQPKNLDSDDEIEIIKDHGLKRKYAAFETLPKRKAKEMPSHLALRSLAHIVGNDDKKRSMNSAELESSLRRKARLQALEERRQRIEELKAKGVVIQTAEERERDQQEVEDLVERARQEAAEIQRREKEVAKKDGTYVKDNFEDEDDESEDGDFEEELEGSQHSGSEEEEEDEIDEQNGRTSLIDDEVEEAKSDEDDENDVDAESGVESRPEAEARAYQINRPRAARNTRVVSDDEDEESPHVDNNQSPQLPPPAKTPQSAPRSVRKVIPGLQMSDDLPMDLSQAFAATMAESQTQGQDSFDLTADLPSPRFAAVPQLQRFDSVDLISDSQPAASQTQPLGVNLLSQDQAVPESPRGLGIRGTQYTPSQRQVPFELTQDNGYIVSPFMGNRFAESPNLEALHSTIDTVVLPSGIEDSPILQRRGRLRRGRAGSIDATNSEDVQPMTAFQVMRQAAKHTTDRPEFDKKRSEARNIIDEAAEESEDEYAGLGGASDDSGDDDENEDDRRMIDEDTQVGKGDEAKLAGLYADRERERDEKEVSKLLKDITTGALRRKRGVGDDLDLSDEEDAAARRREAKRREFAKMRRELLKDEAVGKIAEDKKKEAFLRSIEDREEADEDDEHIDQPEIESQSQSQLQDQNILIGNSQESSLAGQKRKRHLDTASESQLNRLAPALRRTNQGLSRKPATLAEIRESVSFLIEEPDSQAAMVDLGLSDSEDEPEAYVNLDRHLMEAETDENNLDDDNEDLGGFIVDDDVPTRRDSQDDVFKKPELPHQERAPFTERRTKHADIVDRLSLLRQSSSSMSSTMSVPSATSKMAFFSSKAGGAISGAPALLRRATTNSSLGSMSGRDNVSATGVVTSKTERGNAGTEKEFVRKGNGGRRNAVNYQVERKTLREEKMGARAGALKANKSKKAPGFLGGLFRGDSWE